MALIRFGITGGKLKELEKQYAREECRARIAVQDQRIFIGQGSTNSGGGFDLGAEKIERGRGKFIEIENGLYDLEIYATDPKAAADDAAIKDISKMVDIVVVIKPRVEKSSPIQKEPMRVIFQ